MKHTRSSAQTTWNLLVMWTVSTWKTFASSKVEQKVNDLESKLSALCHGLYCILLVSFHVLRDLLRREFLVGSLSRLQKCLIVKLSFKLPLITFSC